MLSLPKTSTHVLASCAILLAGCAALNPAGLIAARSIDPLNANPGDIVFAVGVPASLRLQDGDAEFTLAFQGVDEDADIQIKNVARLRIAQVTGSDLTGKGSEERVFEARLDPADVTAVQIAQRQIKAFRAEGVNGQGTISVEVVGGCYEDTRPTQIAVSTWLQTDTTAGFVPLTRQRDLGAAVGADAVDALTQALKPCPSGSEG